MISEKEAWAAAPNTGFVRKFLEYSYVTTDAPLVYSYAAGLSALSALVNPDAYIQYGPVKYYGNLFSMVIGSSSSRKTACAGVARRMVESIDPDKICIRPESAAYLLQTLAENPQQLVYYGELGEFLQTSQPGGYREGLRTTYMEAWDTPDQLTRGTKKEQVVVLDPRLSLFGAVAPSLLEHYTNPHDYTGGFISRWLLLWGRREREYMPPPDPDPARHAELVDLLHQRLDNPVGPCIGWTQEGIDYFRAWKASEIAKQGRMDEMMEGIFSRAESVAMKVALLYAWDFGWAHQQNPGQPWYMHTDVLAPACAVASMHIQTGRHLLGALALTPFARKRRGVLACLALGYGATEALLLREITPAMSRRDLSAVLETLVAEGTVQLDAMTGTYFLVDPSAAVAQPAPTQPSPQAVAPAPAPAPAQQSTVVDDYDYDDEPRNSGL